MSRGSEFTRNENPASSYLTYKSNEKKFSAYNKESKEYEIHDYKTANSLPNREKFEKRIVETGLSDGLFIEIKSGIDSTQQIKIQNSGE